MRIVIKSIPHKKQRYETIGDWIVKNGELKEIRVSKAKDDNIEFLIAVHEFIEAWLCLKRGITQKEVDNFDIQFEFSRKKGDISEPGDSPKAPYHKEHQFASAIESAIAKQLGLYPQYTS